MVTKAPTYPLALVLAEPAQLPPERNPFFVYVSSLAASGRASQAGVLRQLAGVFSGGRLAPEAFPWAELRYGHLAALRAILVHQGGSPASVNKRLQAIRSILKRAWKLELLSHESYLRAISIEPVAGSREAAGRALEMDEIEKLFASCEEDGGVLGARDACLLALLFGAALRRQEAATVRISGYSSFHATLQVTGKGNVQMTIPLGPDVCRAIDEWLILRSRRLGHDCLPTDPILCSLDKGDRIAGTGDTPLTGGGVWKALASRARRAGVANFSPHDLRRSRATLTIEASGDLSAVQKLLRHKSIQTTVGYDKRGVKGVRRVADMVRTPFRPKAKK